jgi:hypothetical protein
MVDIVTGVYDISTSVDVSSAAIQKAAVTDEQGSTRLWINILVGTVLGLPCLPAAPTGTPRRVASVRSILRFGSIITLNN